MRLFLLKYIVLYSDQSLNIVILFITLCSLHDQDQLLERLQRQALKVVFGTGVTYTKMRSRAGITTLRQRRIELSDKFAAKCSESSRFSHWFPRKRQVRASRNTDSYEELFARCKRYYNSPLFFMRRRLKGKPGLPYWERNRERRAR